MSEPSLSEIVAALTARLEVAAADKRISHGAVVNIRKWLRRPYLARYLSKTARFVLSESLDEVNDAFWKVLEFGTGGRRGKMYPVGTNRINDRTIGECAKGLADYVREQVSDGRLSCAIAYDTRHQSRHFAELCSQIMAAAGFRVFFLDGYRSTPELSFAVRYKKCTCGIMVTASHNPPSDNAVKVYWSSGGQLLPPHDAGVSRAVDRVAYIPSVRFQEGLASGQIAYCQEEVDRAFRAAVKAQSRPGPRDLKIIYSPLHGVGKSAVCPALEDSGFQNVEVYKEHATEDGDFPNVPNHVANPENAEVFKKIITRAKRVGADLILATDPDCDRVGCACPVKLDDRSRWDTLTGNQIGALLADFTLGLGKEAGTLTPEHYVVKTIVTTELIRRIADHYGVQTVGDLMVGFKYIGGAIEERDPAKFVMGAEESYGFLVGAHARDKDAAVSSMLLAELAARLKAQGLTLHEQLDALFRQHGCFQEKTVSQTMPGQQGMAAMRALMERFRRQPPERLGGLRVTALRDYLGEPTIRPIGGPARPLAAPSGDLVMLDLEAAGNYVGVRPSGTEPKVKFYMFAYDPPEQIADLPAAKAALCDRLEAIAKDLQAYCRA